MKKIYSSKQTARFLFIYDEKRAFCVKKQRKVYAFLHLFSTFAP